MKADLELHSTSYVDPSVRIIGSGFFKLGRYSVIEPNVFIDLGQNGSITIGDRAKVKYGAVLRAYDGTIEIKNRVSIGEYSLCAGHGGLIIKDNVIIAGHCYITASGHIYDSEIATRFQGETCKGIEIGENCWVGANATILDGVKLGKGCIIGAGAVVNKAISEHTINVGIPSRTVKFIGEIE
ncbi:acyltransferase [Glaciecola sp. SC05]|uniref:acyltransferase n=1 Tax=Glaciecola sp. SC05 TaxID=1987355 RepID=UPI00352849D2